MKKYKLIKTYPGSPKLGTEALPLEDIYWYKDNMGCSQTLRNIKTYPEYWQEVVEKDYEILSFFNINGLLSTLREDGYYICESYSGRQRFCSKEENNKYCFEKLKIHSVKRLSDGEIFTVGDFAKYLPKYGGQEIKSFYLDRLNRLVVKLTGNEYLLASIIKHKEPLFTTEDGVEVFDLYRDSFYYVRFTKPDYLNPLWEILSINQSLNFKYEPEVEKYFSTKKAAEEYVIMNKPCLSINDVDKIYPTGNISSPYRDSPQFIQAEQIRTLVKQKLGL